LAERRRRAEQLAAQRERMAREQAGYAESLQAAELALPAQRKELSWAQARLAASEQARAAASAASEQARRELDALRGERARAEETQAQARRALADVEARLESLTRL